MQWSTYVKGLSHGGIRIGNFEATLLWMFDKKMGKVTTRRAYELIVSEQLMVMDDNFLLKVWHFNIPQKLKCFIWLTCNL